MDDGHGGHRENGRHKPEFFKAAQNQWLMHQPSMKQIMGIMAERDAAIQERNLAFAEKKTAMAERDMAILQRDTAINERNTAMMERDNAIATLQYRENSINSNNNNNISHCPPGCQISRSVKHVHHPQQHIHNPPHLTESHYNTHESSPLPISPVTSETPKSTKRTKEAKPASSSKRATKNLKNRKEFEDLNKIMLGKSDEWGDGHDMGGGGCDGGGDGGQQVTSKHDWKDQDLGLNQVAFDESIMPVPVCSCTGVLRQCYKWGSGGWQSSCCTTTLSMYPLPAVPSKRHARVGGRKMSGSVFNKLLSRLAGEGHDLSNPVDLKDHWSKHGTNRYITIK